MLTTTSQPNKDRSSPLTRSGGIAALLCAACGCFTPTALGQSLSEIMEVEGTLTGQYTISLTRNGETIIATGVDVWNENGHASGTASELLELQSAKLRLGTSNTPAIEFSEFSGGAFYVGEYYGLSMGKAITGPDPGSVAYDGTFSFTSAVTITLTDFVRVDVSTNSLGRLQYNSNWWNHISIATEFADEATDHAMMTGPRELLITSNTDDVLLVPGVYVVSGVGDGDVELTGALKQSGGRSAILTYTAGFGFAIHHPDFDALPARYDLNNDGVFTLADLEAWRLGSGSQDEIFDTLEDGEINDDDRAELFRALTFAAPESILDCDENGRHDPFEVAYDGVTPSCFDSCPADLDATGTVDFGDLLVVLTNWGACPPDGDAPACPGDIDADGLVGFEDMVQLLADWGPCPD